LPPHVPLDSGVPEEINAVFIWIREARGRFKAHNFLGATRAMAMAMAIRCDFRAINGEAKACAGAALILGGLLLLIAP